MSNVDQIPEQALSWHRAGRGVALATVTQTWGSAPRRVGSQLVIAEDGEMQGSVSGGCVEGAVIVEAIDAIEQGVARELEFGVSDEDAFAVGLACGGTIRVLVEPVGSVLPVALLQDLVTARAARQPVAYHVDLDSGRRWLAPPDPERARQDLSEFAPDSRVFTHVHMPPLRLVIVGAVHIAQALVPMARMVGYDPMIIDPREAFASPARFPDVPLLHDWPDEAVDQVGLDARTALVLLTHDPKLDDPALLRGLASDCFYIGALGSNRTHAKRLERLRHLGDAVSRIHGPVGLNIGAAGPSEIALSILAQMTQVLRQGSA
jgi:xanthine dehydrogenase accessory factor